MEISRDGNRGVLCIGKGRQWQVMTRRVRCWRHVQSLNLQLQAMRKPAVLVGSSVAACKMEYQSAPTQVGIIFGCTKYRYISAYLWQRLLQQ